MESQADVTEIIMLGRYLQEKRDYGIARSTTGKKSCSNEAYADCIYDMLDRLMRKSTEDNCTVPYIRGADSICTKPNDINTTFWIAWNRVTNQLKDCNLPCHYVTANLGAKNYIKNNISDQEHATLYIYYPSRLSKATEHWHYTTLDLFAEIGGYVGLILGYSLFNLASWMIAAVESKINKLKHTQCNQISNTVSLQVMPAAEELPNSKQLSNLSLTY